MNKVLVLHIVLVVVGVCLGLGVGNLVLRLFGIPSDSNNAKIILVVFMAIGLTVFKSEVVRKKALRFFIENQSPTSHKTKTRAEKIAEETIVSLLTDSKYRKKMEGLSEAEIYKTGTLLAKAGMKRLDDKTLERRFEIINQALQSLNASLCASIWNGQSHSDLANFYAKLDDPTLRAFLNTNVTAIKAELEGVKPPETSQSDLEKAWDFLLNTMEPTDKERFLINAEKAAKGMAISDAEACWSARLLYKKISSSSSSEVKATLIRTIIGQSD